jgi:hypothetical protein
MENTRDFLTELRIEARNTYEQLQSAFEQIRSINGRITELQNAQTVDVDVDVDTKDLMRKTYKHTGWTHDRSKGERYKVRVRMGNKYIRYTATPEAADELARDINDALEHFLSMTQES